MSAESPETDEEFKNMVAYFWQEKGDPTRYVGWDEEKCRRLMPTFWFAWRQFIAAEKAVNQAAREASA